MGIVLSHNGHLEAIQQTSETAKGDDTSSATFFDNRSDIMTCVICLDDFYGDEQEALRCGHHFHTKCIQRWLSRNPSCPQCRRYDDTYLQRRIYNADGRMLSDPLLSDLFAFGSDPIISSMRHGLRLATLAPPPTVASTAGDAPVQPVQMGQSLDEMIQASTDPRISEEITAALRTAWQNRVAAEWASSRENEWRRLQPLI